MRRSGRFFILFLLSTAAACWRPSTLPDSAPPGYLKPPGDVDRGARLGRTFCVTCHGMYGDGRGPGAQGLDPAPRSFVKAVYRFRSTPTGSLPTDNDLARTIVRGVPGTSMPAFRAYLDARDVYDLVAWVKSFSPRFGQEMIDDAIHVPPEPSRTAARVTRGQALYKELQCGKCHGDDGSGRGWGTEEDFTDEAGRWAPPRDFRIGIFKSGTRARDVYRALVTGLDGTRMAAYEDAVQPEDMYSLVYYVLSFDHGPGPGRWLSEPPRWYEPTSVRAREAEKK